MPDISLTSPYVTAVLLPLALIALTGIIRKLVRGSDWEMADFYLGVELSLSAITLEVVNFVDVAREVMKKSDKVDPSTIIKNSVFIVGTLVALFMILAFHQDWEKRIAKPVKQRWVLGGLCNLIGIAFMVTFILFVKGVG